MTAERLEQVQARSRKTGKKNLLTDRSTTEELVKSFINWYGYENTVCKLQEE